MYALTNSLVYGVPILLSIMNYIAKVVLSKMSHLEKKSSIANQKYSAAINIMLITFLNIGVMVLLVNLSI